MLCIFLNVVEIFVLYMFYRWILNVYVLNICRFAGADIANICNEAAIVAARNGKKSVEIVSSEAWRLTKSCHPKSEEWWHITKPVMQLLDGI